MHTVIRSTLTIFTGTCTSIRIISMYMYSTAKYTYYVHVAKSQYVTAMHFTVTLTPIALGSKVSVASQNLNWTFWYSLECSNAKY